MNIFNAKIDRSDLLAALTLLRTPTCQIITGKVQHPILGCVRLIADNGRVVMTGTDLDCTVTAELVAETQGQGAVILPCIALIDALKAMSSDDVQVLDLANGKARVASDAGSNTLPTHPDDAWPVESKLWLSSFETQMFDAKQLVDDLKRVRPFISTEETRYYLNGAFFHVDQGKLRVAATNGHQLGVIERDCPEGFENQPDVIVPRNAIEWIKRNAAKRTYVDIGWSASQFMVKLGTVRFCTKVIDGVFPDYRRTIPSNPDNEAIMSADRTAKAVKSASAHINGRNKMVTLSMGQDWHTVVGNDPDNGQAVAMVEGTIFEGEDRACGFNASYLHAVLTAFKGQHVSLRQNDADAPALITSDDVPEFKAVLMPMRDGGIIYSPAKLKEAEWDAIERFENKAPKAIEAVDLMEREGLETVQAKRSLAALVTPAIDLYATRYEVSRHVAREAILTQLAEMGHGTPPSKRRKVRVKSNYVVNGNSCSLDSATREGGPEGNELASCTEKPDNCADHIADAGKKAPVCDNPRYANLQQFKAQAGVGSRWQLQNWNHEAGDWGEPRDRTVATVKARELGFVDGDATPTEIDAANALGRQEGRGWWAFPKQGLWYSTEDALVTLCDDGTPSMRLLPLLALQAAEPDNAMAELAAKVDALASAIGGDAATSVHSLHKTQRSADDGQVDALRAQVERLRQENAVLAEDVAEARSAEMKAKEELAQSIEARSKALLANTELSAELGDLRAMVLRQATRSELGPVVEVDETPAPTLEPNRQPTAVFVPDPEIGDPEDYAAAA